MDDLNLDDLKLDDLDVGESAGGSGGRRGGEKRAKRPKRLLIFLAGLALGVAGTLLGPRYLRPYLPDSLKQDSQIIQGPVEGKRLEGEESRRLLLTVRGEQGAVLATFTRRVAEIDLLVAEGDTITLGVEEYRPFIENPEVRGVRKAVPRAGAGRPDPSSASETSAGRGSPPVEPAVADTAGGRQDTARNEPGPADTASTGPDGTN